MAYNTTNFPRYVKKYFGRNLCLEKATRNTFVLTGDGEDGIRRHCSVRAHRAVEARRKICELVARRLGLTDLRVGKRPTLQETLDEREDLCRRTMLAFDRDDKESTIALLIGWMGHKRVKEMLKRLERR